MYNIKRRGRLKWPMVRGVYYKNIIIIIIVYSVILFKVQDVLWSRQC